MEKINMSKNKFDYSWYNFNKIIKIRIISISHTMKYSNKKGLVRVVKLKCTVGRLWCLTGLGYGTGVLQPRGDKASTLSRRRYS